MNAPDFLSPVQRAEIAELIGEAKPATTSLVQHMAKAVHDRATHEHPTWEDLYCLNLVSWLGERMAPVLRRLLEAEARIAELETAPTTLYRAEHPDSGITLGHYGTPAAARAHCEATERRSWPTGTTLSFDWIEDEDDGVAELVVTAGQNEESVTGYIVTALDIPSEYDAEQRQHATTGTSEKTSSPAEAASSREARLAQLLDSIRTHRGAWHARRVVDLRRFTGGPTKFSTARGDLAELYRRGHLRQHGPESDRFYTLKLRKDGA
ncbi:hypothetical protein ACFY78_18805 [Streptomyces olindensis]|uniref:hypothetical protein n=1 Tax=Streptomyces olindensis TaxID=358823 RepID=UPI003695605B